MESYRIQLSGDRLLMRLSDRMHETRCSWDTERHSNAEFEVHMLLEGSCRVDVEDQQFLLEPLQAIIIAPGQYHQPHPLSGGVLRLSVSFDVLPGRLKTALLEKIPTAKSVPLSTEQQAAARIVLRECGSRGPLADELISALLTQLMVDILRQLELTQPVQRRKDGPQYLGRVDTIDQFFAEHFREKAGEELLAQKLYVSRRQLARILKENYGMGYRQKLILTRMDHAAMLLRTTQKRSAQIASEVGYDSEAAFYQVFRKHFGVTPSRYRQRQGK